MLADPLTLFSFCRLRSFMETDARGQLGGLETTEAVRKRMAAESPAFKCASCGKTNAQIMQECEERVKESSSAAEEVEVPKDLNMGWRDEMEAKKKATADPQTTTTTVDDDSESAELAEGFVQTVPSSSSVAASMGGASTATAPSNTKLPTPTRTSSLAGATATANSSATTVRAAPRAPVVAAPPPQPARRASDDGVPLWLDRLIVVMVVLLVALVLKIIFAM